MTSDQFARAAAGFAEGGRYDRARPGYPAEAVDALVAALDVRPGAPIVDLAAGTGKFTRELVARGLDVVAVEPVAGMRETLVGALPGVRVLDGRAEALPFADGSMDAVTVAQAFHWFDGAAALSEIHRVLRPAGALGLLWNVMDRSVGWVDRIQAAIHVHRGPHPWYAGHRWREAFAGDDRFGPLAHRAFRNTQPVDRGGLRDRVMSISFVSSLEAPLRGALLAEVDAIAGEVHGDAPFQLPYVTDVFWCSTR